MTKTPASPENQWDIWAAQAQSGDQKAYRQLLNDITPYIQGSVYNSLANPDWVDDLTQNILLSVHKALATYSSERPFKPWLSAIINFRRTDFLRAHYNRRGNKAVSFDETFMENKIVTNSPHAGEYKDIERALAMLSKKQRKVFTLIKLEGYTAKEVAKKTGLTVSAVKVSAHRSTIKLKELLG